MFGQINCENIFSWFFELRKANTVIVEIKSSVIFAHENIAQNP